MTRTQLLIASGNAGKLREIRALLSDLPINLLSLVDFPAIEVVAETGATFAKNASLKAREYARQARRLTLADDSGLEVDALDGAPGVLSARYLSETASYVERIHALLAELGHVASQDRNARFVCAVAIASRDGDILYTTQAACDGHIANAARGIGGFGYDPVFIPEGFDRTFGELPADVKNQISHRGRALAATREFLASLTVTLAAG